MRRTGSFLGVALALTGLGCSTTASRLKTRFATEQGCPSGQVAVSEQGGAVYRASGCGQSTEYVCEGFAGMGDPSRQCFERGSNPHVPTGSPPPQNTSRPDLVAPK